MRMPEIYTERKVGNAPMPFLSVSEKMRVVAVDNHGGIIANITDEGGRCLGAREALEDNGYDATWAVWDEEGAFIELAE